MTTSKVLVGMICLACAMIAVSKPAFAADAAQTCTLKRIAVLDTDLSRGNLAINVQIDGRDVKVMIDTGSPFNMVSRRLADQLKLPLLETRENAVIDAAGKSARHMVMIHNVTFGGVHIDRNIPFVVMGEDQQHESNIDGIFGASFLMGLDVELDLGHNKMSLYSQDHCPGNVVYWTQNYVAVPFILDASRHMTFKAELEGNSLRAMLDTGATPSILSAQTARRLFDFEPGPETPPDGFLIAGGGTSMPFYRHVFKLLDIGGVEIRNAELQIVADKASRVMREHAPVERDFMNETLETPLIIGLHHLTKLRAYIAYGERMLYISAADAQ